MKYRLIKLLGGYSAREYQKLETHYDVLLSRSQDALEREQEARRESQLELERLKEWRNKIVLKLRRAGIKERIINNLLKD